MVSEKYYNPTEGAETPCAKSQIFNQGQCPRRTLHMSKQVPTGEWSSKCVFVDLVYASVLGAASGAGRYVYV